MGMRVTAMCSVYLDVVHFSLPLKKAIFFEGSSVNSLFSFQTKLKDEILEVPAEQQLCKMKIRIK